MFGHIFKNQLKRGIRNKSNILWCLIFPIALGTLFYAAFGELYSSEALDSIKTAIVIEDSSKEDSKSVQTMMEGLEFSDGTKILDITYTDKASADKLLEDKDIEGIFVIKSLEDVSLVVGERGINESILGSIVSQYCQTVTMIKEIGKSHPEKIAEAVTILQDGINCSKDLKLTDGNMDPYVAYFYNLIAMVCLFAALMGLVIPISSQANLSPLGARCNISPVSKLTSEIAALLAQTVIQLIVTFITLVYFIYILGINFGGKDAYIFLAAAVGTIFGMSLGFLVGHIGNGSSNTKEGILTGVILAGCFMSGLMFANIKIILQQKCPVVNKINPVAIITDSFYSLNIYGAGERFFTDLFTLLIVSVLFTAVAVCMARRSRYASI